ncbi:uncharacterized protein LOC113793732 isoform X1 [Dermatophagoides pteronyssinus]|uniref:uncharacterized protein LOC113793732 isoform X1 n=1 Tax=Dermatophagoides pteronyssinus TaxID=6956 RepID=UPI003F66590B
MFSRFKFILVPLPKLQRYRFGVKFRYQTFMRLIHFIQLAILMVIFLWSIKIILINFVFTTNEQELHLVIDDYNDEEDNDAKESYIDQIDARSLGQRVELPIPDEELTTILTTTLSIESYTNMTTLSSTTESSIIIEDQNENSTPSMDAKQPSTVVSTSEETNEETYTPLFDIGDSTPGYSTTESSSSTEDITDSSVDFEIPMTTSTFTTDIEDASTLSIPSTTVDQIDERTPDIISTSSTTSIPIMDVTQMATMSGDGISSSESTTAESSTNTLSISTISPDDEAFSTEQESSTTNVPDMMSTETAERTAIPEISTLMSTFNSADELTESTPTETTTSNDNSLMTDSTINFNLMTTTEMSLNTEIPSFSTVTATSIDEFTSEVKVDETTNLPPTSTTMTKEFEPTDMNSVDIDSQMPSSFDQNNGVDSSTAIPEEMPITQTVRSTTAINEETDQEFTTDQAISSHTIDMGMTTRLMAGPDETLPLEPISSTTQSILMEMTPTTTQTIINTEGDDESRTNEQPTTDQVEIITTSTTTEAPVIIETITEEPTTTISTPIEERVPITTISPATKTDKPLSTSTVSVWDQSTTTMMTTITTLVPKKTTTTIGSTKTMSKRPTQSNGRPSNTPFWMRFWPSSNEGWNSQINPCVRWSHSSDMDNDEQRTESQWSILPSHIHKLWQRMFRLNHYRCQISNERRNIQHGLILALEQYRDRISKEIIALSEILRPIEPEGSQQYGYGRGFFRSNSKTQEELVRLNRLLQLTSNFLKQLNRFNHYEWLTN